MGKNGVRDSIEVNNDRWVATMLFPRKRCFELSGPVGCCNAVLKKAALWVAIIIDVLK